MVYHHPSEQPWYNSAWLGPLRILLSDNQAAQLVRTPLVMMTRAAIFIYGATSIITRLPWSDEVKSSYWKHIKRPVWQWVTGLTVGYGFYTYLKLVNVKWEKHLKPLEDWRPYKFFRVSESMPLPFDDKRRDPHQLPGAVYVRDRKTWYSDPILTNDNGMIRALNSFGMKYWDFFWMECTVGLEYPLTAFTRILRHYSWFKSFNRKADRNRLYQAILNSSMICYTCFDESNVEEYSHVVLRNVRLPYAQNSTRTFDKIVAIMNHDTFEVEKVITYYTREEDKTTEVHVWGSRVASENFGGLSLDESLHQAGLLLAVTVAYFSHGVVHWWATGVTALDKSVWKTQIQSNNITQWMNSQAIFFSWVFFGNSVETTNNFIVYNNANGFPIHGLRRNANAADIPADARLSKLSPADLQHALGQRSAFHHMSFAVQGALTDLMHAKYDPDTHVIPEIEGITSATIRHNMEHFFVADNLPIYTDGSCIALQSDLSGLLMCLIMPIDYWLRSLKVKQYRKVDDISAAIYTSAKKEYKNLVQANDEARSQGKIPPFANLDGFVEKFLCIGCAV